MKDPAGFQAIRELGNEIGPDQASLVVTRFGPGVGEKDLDTVQHGRRDHVTNDFHRIMLNDSKVG